MDVAVFVLFALLLSVAASCGVAALHGCLRGRALAGSAPAAVVAGAASTACLPEPSSGSGGQADDGHVIRLGVLALVLVTAVVALGSPGGNGSGPGGVGSALAVYSLLVGVISASSLVRRTARSAIDPQEG